VSLRSLIRPHGTASASARRLPLLPALGSDARCLERPSAQATFPQGDERDLKRPGYLVSNQ